MNATRDGQMVTYKFRGILSYSSYVQFLRFIAGRPPRDLQLDFGSVVFFHPDGMAPLVAMIRHMQDELGWEIEAVYPSQPMLEDYFDKAGWGPGIMGERPVDPPIGATYVPLTHYENDVERHGTIRSAMDCLRRTATYEAGVLDAVEWSLDEVTDNVLLHSGVNPVGWIQVAARPRERQVEIVVVDCGQGVTASLRQGLPNLASDAEALRFAIQKGVTRDLRVGLGNGLNGTLRLATSAQGWANFHSGSASLRLRETGARTVQASAPHHQGLVVSITLPTNAAVDVQRALWGDQPVSGYENAHADASGVRFPIEEYATSGFGSREAARPLRTLVENLLVQFPDDPILVDFGEIPAHRVLLRR